MNNQNTGAVVDLLRRLAAPDDDRELTDRQLLQQFAATGDQYAFASLVKRHGSLVLNVCRRLLRIEQDAEDAFQAAFLVLARKAGQIQWDDSIVCWLHEVAWRTAVDLRGRIARKSRQETTMAEMPDAPAPSVAQGAWDELSTVLDEELRRLPEKYRAPLVLCYLEGRTRDEAGEMLGWSAGSVKGRLERGREILRRRLVRRGVTIGAGLAATLPAGLAHAMPTPVLMGRTIRLVMTTSAGTSSVAWTVAEQVMAQMARGRLFMWAALLATLAAAGIGTAAIYWNANEPTGQPADLVGSNAGNVRVVGVALDPGPIMEHGGTVEGVAVASDGRLATAAFNDGFTLFDARNGVKLHQWEMKGPHTLIAISPGDRLAAAGTITGKVAIFDIGTKNELASWDHERGNLFGLAFSPDGEVLAASYADGSIALHDAHTGKHRTDLKSDGGRARKLHFTPAGDLLLVGREDGSVRFWDWRNAREIHSLAAGEGDVLAMDLSRDGHRLVTGGADRWVRYWDLDAKRELFAHQFAFPNTLALSPDGTLLACGDNRGFVKVWSTANGALQHEVKAHPGGVQCVTFSPDGRRLFSCGSDKRAVVWELRLLTASAR